MYCTEQVLNKNWRLYIAENQNCRTFADNVFNEKALKEYGIEPISASVPGNFELDMQKAGLIDDPFYADNPLKIQRLENRHLWYAVDFEYTGNFPERAYLKFDGIDTFSDIYLNGGIIGSTDNMFIAYEFAAKEIKNGVNELLVHIKPTVIEARRFNFDMDVLTHQKYNAAALSARKVAHSFGWDIMPRFVSGGIWRSCFLIEKKADYIEDIFLSTAEIKETFINLNHFEGNIFECIDEGIAFILSAIDWNIVIDGAAKRKEEPEIPQKAIREMVVNAFAHGCYFSNTSFTIEVFSDKVMIYSPGLFPVGFKPEDFAENSAEPIMLNPKIVNVLFKCSVIESFGTGYERTFTSCKSAGVKYEYENTKTGFRFIFYRAHGHENVHKMSKSEKAVYDLLCECDCLTIAELAKRIGKTDKTVYRAIKALKENGYIVREGTDTSGYWKILK